MARDRRTKIIATVGPASWDDAVLARLIEAGADVLRLNFSHADRERHARTVEAIRAAAELEAGMHVKLTPEEVEGDRGTIPVAWRATARGSGR